MQNFELVPEQDHNRPDWVPVAKVVKASTFQRFFFEDLAAIPVKKKEILFEKARQKGIPKEAVEAFWDTSHSRR